MRSYVNMTLSIKWNRQQKEQIEQEFCWTRKERTRILLLSRMCIQIGTNVATM